ncbi:MAG: DegV family protein [Lachnospiraceae bacterium]|nr:DegV family protein [Lachnospiraceae bacterium]
MSDYILSCCSAIDLTPDMIRELDVKCLPFFYTIGDDTFEDDMFTSISAETFYGKMEEGLMTGTSQNNVSRYTEYFEPMLKDGKDILHITLSSGLSGTYSAACIAAEDLMADYPDRKIRVVDSRGACGGYGLLVLEAAELRDQGLSLDELTEKVEELRFHIHHWFFSTTLKYYIRGGRISKTAGVFATALNICPLNNMDEAGHLIVREKVRTKKKVRQTIVDRMAEHAEGGEAYSGKVLVNYSGADDSDAVEVIRMIEERFPNVAKPIPKLHIGPTIGAHTGPGTLAVFFNGDTRVGT